MANRSAPSAWASALAGAVRACDAATDSLALREAIARRTGGVLRPAAWSLCVTDPATGLMTHAINAGYPAAMEEAYAARFYPDEEAIRYLDMARARRLTTDDASPEFTEVIGHAGMGSGLRVALTVGGTLWGTWSLLRERGTAPYGDDERRFLARLAPHVAQALRRTALTEQASSAGPTTVGASDTSSADRADDGSPAVLTLDAAGRRVFQTANAAAVLADLGDRTSPDVLPSAVSGALAQLRLRQGQVDARPAGTLTARGTSGRRYALHAALTEPNAAGDSFRVITIGRVQPVDASGAIALRYGLSPREHAVLLRVARGESTKQIAAALQLSTYTVQDYVGHACDKVGVANRRELVAKLFLDAFGGG